MSRRREGGELNLERLSKSLAGRVVERVERSPSGAVIVRFTDGSALVAEPGGAGVEASLVEALRHRVARSKNAPTPRQREYLDFITRYIARYGHSPAETDIQRHFMVTAPAAHEMIRTLERRGFITRQRDFGGQAVPRSIRVVGDPP